MKGPTEHLGASLLLVIPTTVQLGDTWVLKTVASRFQVVRFVSISRIQMSLLLLMRLPAVVLCSPVLLLGSLTLERLSFGSRRETVCLHIHTTFCYSHEVGQPCVSGPPVSRHREHRATSRKLKVGSGALHRAAGHPPS